MVRLARPTGDEDMNATRQEVYAAIDDEREYQQIRWNEHTTVSGGHHPPEAWIVYMENYLAEAKQILSRGEQQEAYLEAMHILRKVTALGVAAMEDHGAPLREWT